MVCVFNWHIGLRVEWITDVFCTSQDLFTYLGSQFLDSRGKKCPQKTTDLAKQTFPH